MATKTKTEKPKRVKVSYLLPESLVRKMRMEAAERSVWPATIVAERLAAPAPKPMAARRNAG